MLFELSYISCPHCKKWYKVTDILSYTVHEKCESWSDGKNDRPFLVPFEYPFVHCSDCGMLFWKEDCSPIRDYEITAYQNHEIKDVQLRFRLKALIAQDEVEEISDVDDPFLPVSQGGLDSALEILNKLITNDLSDDRVHYVRQLIRQQINDLIRFSKPIHFWKKGARKQQQIRKDGREKFRSYHAARIANLEALAANVEASLALADTDFMRLEFQLELLEIERELAHFKKAKVLLKNLRKQDLKIHYNPKTVAQVLKKSSRLIAKKSSEIFRV